MCKNFWANFLRVFQLLSLKMAVSALTSVIFLRSFSNMARRFIVLRSRPSSIMEVLPHLMGIMEHLMSPSILAFLDKFFKLLNMLSNISSRFYHN